MRSRRSRCCAAISDEQMRRFAQLAVDGELDYDSILDDDQDWFGRQNLRASFSPNGDQLALVNLDDAGYRIAQLDLDTQELRVLSEGPLDESPSYAPNGAVIIYSTSSGDGAELATVTTDGRVRQRLRQPGEVREPAWSPRTR